MAIGYYDHPVTLGMPGEDLPHVHHYYGEPHPTIASASSSSAAGTRRPSRRSRCIAPARTSRIVHRAPTLKSTIKYWVRPDIENRIKEGSVAAHFSAVVREIRPTSIVIAPANAAAAPPPPPDVAFPADGSKDFAAPVRPAPAGELEIPADAVYLLTGYRADAELLRHAGVLLNERDAPVHDPETFETNVPGLFVAGGAIAGVDTGTIFIENGRFHGEKIIRSNSQRRLVELHGSFGYQLAAISYQLSVVAILISSLALILIAIAPPHRPSANSINWLLTTATGCATKISR